MLYRIMLFCLSSYIIYLYSRELLLERGIELPVVNGLEFFDILVVHFGGLLTGILFLLIKRNFEKWMGIGMIVLNVVMLPYLYWQAIN